MVGLRWVGTKPPLGPHRGGAKPTPPPLRHRWTAPSAPPKPPVSGVKDRSVASALRDLEATSKRPGSREPAQPPKRTPPPLAPRMHHSQRPHGQKHHHKHSAHGSRAHGPAFRDASPLSLDATAFTDLHAFLERTGQAATITAAPRGDYPSVRLSHIARVFFRPCSDPEGAAVTAVGAAASSDLAAVLCAMHARALVDWAASGRCGAPPTPLRFVADIDHAAPLLPPRPVPPLPTAALGDHEAYTAAAAEYAAAAARAEERAALAKGRAPVTGNVVVDKAAIRVQQRSVDPSARQVLARVLSQQGYSGAIPDPTVATVGPRVKVAVFTVPTMPHAKAFGTGRNKKEATAKAAAHAVEILRGVRPPPGGHRAAPSGASEPMAGSRFVRRAADPSSPPAPSPTAPALDAAEQRQALAVYAALMGLEQPSMAHTASTHSCGCTAALGDTKCHASGLSRADAEDSAVHALFGALAEHDPTFARCVDVAAAHPALLSSPLFDLTLGDGTAARIDDLADRAPVPVTLGAGTTQPLEAPTRRLVGHISARDGRDAATVLQRRQEVLASPEYQERFMRRRSTLPMAGVREELLALVAQHQVVVVCGTTGCGKTTQVPQYLLDDALDRGTASAFSMLVTQPRRLSAMSIAERIAAERLEPIGRDVGYCIRLDTVPGRRINLLTTGVLLQLFQSDASLEGITHLVLDEVHDRDLFCDFSLVLVKQLLTRNPHIRVLLMSATLQAEVFSDYFGGAPVVNVDGQAFPVEERYIDDIAEDAIADGVPAQAVQQLLRPESSPQWRGSLPLPPKKMSFPLLAYVVDRAIDEHQLTDRSVLVFLPGWKEIAALNRELQSGAGRHKGRYHTVLLHSSVDSEAQRRCFEPAPPGMVKVVIATNIAESGVTIDDVGVVIDGGTVKQMSCVLRDNSDADRPDRPGRGDAAPTDDEDAVLPSVGGTVFRLEHVFAAKANCTQRRGRAGRTAGGVVYRLFPRSLWQRMPAFQTAEILRQPLDAVILRILAMGFPDPRGLLGQAVEPPPEALVSQGIALLGSLGAVTADLQLTSMGRWLSRLPTEPRIGKMILLGAAMGCLDPALTIAGAQESDPFLASRELRSAVRKSRNAFSRASASDHVAAVNAYNTVAGCYSHRGRNLLCSEHYLSGGSIANVSRYKHQFYGILSAAGFVPPQGNAASVSSARGDLFVERSALSRHGQEAAVIKAVVCAGMFPNVAVAQPKASLPGARPGKNPDAGRKVKLCRTRQHSSVGIGPQSVVPHDTRHAGATRAPFYVFDAVMNVAGADFLSRVSQVSLWAVVLLGASGEDQVQYHADLNLAVVDGWLVCRCDRDTMDAVRRLKALLHASIAAKFTQPHDAEVGATLDAAADIVRELVCAAAPPCHLSSTQNADEWGEQGSMVSPN